MRSFIHKAHDMLSRSALLPLSRARRMLRASSRPATIAFNEGMRFRKAACNWSDDKKREWILSRLRYVTRRAYSETVYYREMFDRAGFDPHTDFSFDDYALLPVLDREDIHEAGRSIVSTAVPEDQMRRDATGGSTGRPTEIWMGPEEIGWRESAGESALVRLGVGVGARTAFFWGHHLDPVAADSLRDRMYNFTNNVRWFDCFRLSEDVLECYHREFTRWRPDVIIAYASALGSLAEYLLERGIKPLYPTRRLITGAEKLLPRHREIIRTVFDAPLHERYGSRDIGYIGYQMRPEVAPDFEIDWANLLVEPETREAESSILITKLHADAMPMLRYRIGDIGRFLNGQLTGHPSFELPEIVGRETERIWLTDGRWIHGIQIPHLMKDFPVREFQLTQRADFSIELNVVPANGFGQRERTEIAMMIAANLPGLEINVAVVEDIPRTGANKWRPVISEVKLAGAEAL